MLKTREEPRSLQWIKGLRSQLGKRVPLSPSCIDVPYGLVLPGCTACLAESLKQSSAEKIVKIPRRFPGKICKYKNCAVCCNENIVGQAAAFLPFSVFVLA